MKPRNTKERIILLKVKLDITSKAMAKKVGIPYAQYLAYERSKYKLRPMHMRLIEEFGYECSKLEDLVFDKINQHIRVWLIVNNHSIKDIVEEMKDSGVDVKMHQVNSFVLGRSIPTFEFLEFIREKGYEPRTT